MPQPHILILAAGASSRMAPLDKLTEAVDGQPLLRRTAQRALATAAPVTVVLPPDRPARIAALQGLALQTVIAQDAADGMAASLRAGLAALPPGTTAAMIMPADMPGLTTADLTLLLSLARQHPDAILRATTADGHEGHPVLFPARFFPDLQAASGDEGGRATLRAHRAMIRQVPLPGQNAILDLDTPADWAAFNASGGQ